MELEAGDVIQRAGRRALIVVALCEDPSRAWVISHFDHGLVNGGAELIELVGYCKLVSL